MANKDKKPDTEKSKPEDKKNKSGENNPSETEEENQHGGIPSRNLRKNLGCGG